MDSISTEGLRFVDGLKRERIFRGVNIVDKRAYTDGLEQFPVEFTDELLSGLKKRGINILRLGFTWSLLEPEPGRYNDRYLDSVETILNRCAEHGIHVFLDMHQDLYSAFNIGLGDGAPLWACLTGKTRARPTHLIWDEGYWRGRAVQKAFDSFWSNAEYGGKGLLDWYAGCWDHIARRFSGKEALFGYDFINEPFPGTDGGKVFRRIAARLVGVTLFSRDIHRAKLLGDAIHKKRRERILNHYDENILPRIVSAGNALVSRFDTEQYSPFLDQMASAVRQASPAGIVAVDNCYYSNLGIPSSVRPIVTGGRRDSRQCFSPHGYDLPVDTPMYKYANNERAANIFREHRRTQERLGMPVLVGEWGGYNGDDPDCLRHLSFLMDLFDEYKWSSTYWHYCDNYPDSPLMEALCRPYPKAVTGEIAGYRYSGAERTFTLTYRQDGTCRGETVIYSPWEPLRIQLDGTPCTPSLSGYDYTLTTGEGTHTVVIQY